MICTASACTILTQMWDADAWLRGWWLGVENKAHEHEVQDHDTHKGERGQCMMRDRWEKHSNLRPWPSA